CQSTPLSDIKVEVTGLRLESSVPPLVETLASVVSVEALTHDIKRLSVECKKPVSYLAGQYASLSAPGVGPRSYSFSQGPAQRESERHLRFDIRILEGGQFSQWLDQHAAEGSSIELAGPRGSFHLRASGAPIVAVAGGTGLGPILSILEELDASAVARDVVVLFGARSERDLYGLEELEALKRSFPARLEVWPVLSAQYDGWSGRTGMVTEHLNDVPRLGDHHAYLCGPPGMIDAALPIFEGAGISEIFFDKFLDTSVKT
ncbi:MAG: FAD-binding oxidoreductase, partial [Myxococcota bacterium]